MNYIFWLIISCVSFALAEFLSKKFALDPTIKYIVLVVVLDIVSTLTWLPVILQKNQLSIAGTMWLIIGLVCTVLIGVLLFQEKLSMFGWAGIAAAFISVVLLSL